MNQILDTNDIVNEIPIQNMPSPFSKRRFLLLKFQVFTSIAIAVSLLLFYLYNLYEMTKQEKLSENLINNFNISRLYSNSQKYLTTPINTTTPLISIIGILEIDKINLNYPIISDISEDLLKIAPCKFFGPNPNEIGNLCIAAHNYNNYKFFSKIKTLNIGDIITIYDLNGAHIQYSIYDKQEVLQTDTSITSQDTNNSKEITLITCNNIKGKRIVIKAKSR